MQDGPDQTNEVNEDCSLPLCIEPAIANEVMGGGQVPHPIAATD